VEDRIKCGVIGAGWWATFAHIPALLSDPRVELLAIQKSDREAAQKVAADFGVPCHCTSAEDLLSLERLEAVVISSSPNLHYEQAAAALRSGKHVLVEKPMTFTVRQADHLVDLARKRELQLLISCPWHYTWHALAAQRMIREGVLGKNRMISVLMTNPVSHLIRGQSTAPTHGKPYMYPRTGTYSDPKVAGGSQIYAQVSHAAAYLTFLTGARAHEVFARFHNDGTSQDIYDALDLRMEDGTIVTVASTGATSTNLRTYEVRVFGTEGMLYLDLWRGTMESTRMNGMCESFPCLQEDEIYPHQAPAHNLIDAIADAAMNRSPGVLGVAAMEVIEAACVSARTGENIRVLDLREELR
jgi:predicted dehydrogenase